MKKQKELVRISEYRTKESIMIYRLKLIWHYCGSTGKISQEVHHYMWLILHIFVGPRIGMVDISDKDRSRTGIFHWYDILLMVEDGIIVGMCYAIDKYAIVNNKYMEVYYLRKDSSYHMYWDANNLYGWGIRKVAHRCLWMEKKQVYIQWRVHTNLWWRQLQGIKTQSNL